MELDDFPKAKESPALTVSPTVALLDPFALFPYPEDAWARVEERKCFTGNELSIGVDWVDVNADNSAIHRKFTSLDQINEYISEPDRNQPDLRVISLNQRFSWGFLNVTQNILSSIIDAINASPELLEVISCFYKKNSPIEEAFSNAPFIKHNKDSIEIMYIFKYVAYKHGQTQNKPWSIRQTGVYQRYDLINKRSVWIFIHPGTESPFQSRLNQLLTSLEGCSQIQSHPLLLHNLLFTTYSPRWRDFMSYQENKIWSLAAEVRGNGIETSRVNYQTLSSAYPIENDCLALRPIFHSLGKILEAVHKTTNSLYEENVLTEQEYGNIVQVLDNHSKVLDAYVQNNLYLQHMVERTAQLITDTISLKNSEYTMDLTLSTVNDSTTVRTITIVTLIYLPSTFTATVLGMNSFFEMSPNNDYLVVSHQFWIFVACAVPLTVITVLYWLIRKRVRDRRRVIKMESRV
ncbi:hypothetical protein ASPWEDRAFT_644130 [Aspergillus wentii DTO 134E9]|uniref:CorA-like transporter domain-containing protein n=1 Tax=Aspergillus wentii DTO 134E9 TaxID=1073089 RepID=A0A1L9RAU0_ASPWE|nr:uncharacterized protein ASPWEDRAFT_644130 [Aspergillus wentii DTO 134E9]OJJ31993.1 hypothetical protein ASPWEDRAFT_644130 [Aspergillus wentii DTO 134E9]